MRRLAVPVLLLAMILALPGCDGDGLAAARQETLIIGKSSGLSTIDPGATVHANNFGPMALAYQRLLEYEVDDGIPTGAVRGALAESWLAEDGGRIWRIALRPGHRFADGTPVTAAAVRFSFLRTRDLGLGPAQVLPGLLDVEVVDDYTVRFQLQEPSPIFPLLLALPPMVIINPAVLMHEEDGDRARAWLAENTAGSGPYQVTAWGRGQQIVLQPNPHAVELPRQFRKIVFKAVRDNASRRLLLERGDIDIFEGVSPDMADRLEQHPEIVVLERPTPVVVAMAMNTTRGLLADKRVRRALSLAVDRRVIANGVVHGRASLLQGVLPEGIPGHDATIPLVERDLERARLLLREAGVPPGRVLTLSFVPASSTIEATALALQSQLGELGLDVRLEALAPAAYSKVLGGDFDLTLASWNADFPDPWPLMQFAYHSSNVGDGYNLSRYASAAVDELLGRAERSMVPEERIALYRAAQQIVVDDQPMVGLFAVHGLLAHRRSLRELGYNSWQPGIYDAVRMYREEGR